MTSSSSRIPVSSFLEICCLILDNLLQFLHQHWLPGLHFRYRDDIFPPLHSHFSCPILISPPFPFPLFFFFPPLFLKWFIFLLVWKVKLQKERERQIFHWLRWFNPQKTVTARFGADQNQKVRSFFLFSITRKLNCKWSIQCLCGISDHYQKIELQLEQLVLLWDINSAGYSLMCYYYSTGPLASFLRPSGSSLCWLHTFFLWLLHLSQPSENWTVKNAETGLIFYLDHWECLHVSNKTVSFP